MYSPSPAATNRSLRAAAMLATAALAAATLVVTPGAGADTPGGSQAQAVNGKIAFTALRDGNFEIYVMDADGTNRARLTDNPAFDADPAFSPDGTKIAFTSTRHRPEGIYVMDADGGNPTRLTDNTAFDYEPAFSPDGTKIAFTSTPDGVNTDIHVMNADGTSRTNLTNNPLRDEYLVRDYQPSWGSVPSVVDTTPYFLGFQSPLPKATVTRGSTLPVKFELGTMDGATTYTDVTDLRVTLTPGATDAPCTYDALVTAYRCNLRLPRQAGDYSLTIERQGDTGWAPLSDADSLTGNGNGLPIRLR